MKFSRFVEIKSRRPVVPGCAGCAMADQLTVFQPGGTDYAHLITTGTPGFSDLPTALPSRDRVDWGAMEPPAVQGQ